MANVNSKDIEVSLMQKSCYVKYPMTQQLEAADYIHQ
jgi:hypothetical protein